MAKNLPPTYDKIAKHEVFPETTSDEKARYNFLANLNKHLAHVSQGNAQAYEPLVGVLWRCDSRLDVLLLIVRAWS